MNMDELKRKLIANWQGYLRQREDFIASIPTMDPVWTAPFNIIGNIFEPILGSIDGKCPNLFLLFDNIIRSEEIRAGAIRFEIEIFSGSGSSTAISEFNIQNNEICYNFNLQGEEQKLAIYLGTSGCQALYSIIENILRNTARHSKREELEKVKNYSKSIIEKQKPDGHSKPLTITIEFHYDDLQYKDDYVKVKIYDNMGGWEKENENIRIVKEKKNSKDELKLVLLGNNEANLECIKQKIQKGKYSIAGLDIRSVEKSEKEQRIEEALNKIIFNRRFSPGYKDGKIIDETGKIIEGAWGLKEMRICASFLRGLKISEYEIEKSPPVITPFVECGNLGVEFYIPKLKDLLVVSRSIYKELEKNNKINELKNKGIYIETDITEITGPTYTHEFVVIDIDEQENVSWIKDNILKLPYKLFYLSQNGNIPTDIKEVDKRADKRVIKKGEFKLEVLGLFKKWQNYLDTSISTIMIKGRDSKWEITETNTQNIINDREFLNKCQNKYILDHKWEYYNGIIKKKPYFYAPYRHIPKDGFYLIIENPLIEKASNTEDYKRAFSNFIEVASTNVVIIDERIFTEFGDRKNIYDNNVFLGYYWFLQNVMGFNLYKDKLGKYHLSYYKINMNDRGLENVSVTKEEIEINKITDFQNIFKENLRNKIHFLIIHQTIIENKIGGKEGFKKFIELLPKEYRAWYTVVTSGRGHPERNKMPDYSKFIHFSDLRSYTVENPNKYLLVKVISSLKDEK